MQLWKKNYGERERGAVEGRRRGKPYQHRALQLVIYKNKNTIRYVRSITSQTLRFTIQETNKKINWLLHCAQQFCQPPRPFPLPFLPLPSWRIISLHIILYYYYHYTWAFAENVPSLLAGKTFSQRERTDILWAVLNIVFVEKLIHVIQKIWIFLNLYKNYAP